MQPYIHKTVRRYQHKESLWAMPVEELHMDTPDVSRPILLLPSFSGEAFSEVCAYPVIVEAWEKRLHGLGRRRYHAAFSVAERATIARYHTHFRRWYLVTGTPRRIILRLRTLHLLNRAVAFFATV
jgi:hypothetical protein